MRHAHPGGSTSFAVPLIGSPRLRDELFQTYSMETHMSIRLNDLGRRRSWQPHRFGRLAAAVALGLGGWTAAQAGDSIVGLTLDWQLVTFDSDAPTNASNPLSISGLQTNEVVLGIDFRPTTGVLYGIGSFNNLYTLNASTGAATLVAALSTAPGSASFAGLSSSQSYGIDFNPVPDLAGSASLRLTASDNSNYRINVNPASAGQVTVDGGLNGVGGASVVGSAYINNDINPATGTALFHIDSTGDRLLTSNNPNAGNLSVVGSLGVNTTGLVGFDVLTAGASNTAYASFTDELTNKSSLYTVNLSTGLATLIGAYGVAGNTSVAASLRDIAVTPVPEPSSYALMLAGLGVIGAGLGKRRKG